MRGNRKIALKAALILTGAVTAYGLFPSPEPQFEGRNLRSWLARAETLWFGGSEAGQGCDQNQVDHAVREMGTNALPVLISMLESKDGAIKEHLVAWSRALPHWPFHPTAAAQNQSRALLGFKILGPIAGPAVPALTELLRHSEGETAVLASRALSRIGPAATNAVPALVKNLSDQDIAVRSVATNALKRIDPLAAFSAGITVG
jgi:hypothetical protein